MGCPEDGIDVWRRLATIRSCSPLTVRLPVVVNMNGNSPCITHAHPAPSIFVPQENATPLCSK